MTQRTREQHPEIPFGIPIRRPLPGSKRKSEGGGEEAPPDENLPRLFPSPYSHRTTVSSSSFSLANTFPTGARMSRLISTSPPGLQLWRSPYPLERAVPAIPNPVRNSSPLFNGTLIRTEMETYPPIRLPSFGTLAWVSLFKQTFLPACMRFSLPRRFEKTFLWTPGKPTNPGLGREEEREWSGLSFSSSIMVLRFHEVGKGKNSMINSAMTHSTSMYGRQMRFPWVA